MKKKPVFALFLIFAMLVSGCSGRTGGDTAENESEQSEVSSDRASAEIFSDRDFEVGYDEGESAVIQLNGDSASCSSDAVQISGGTFIGTGAAGMAQSFSSSEQGVIAVKTGAQSAGTVITLTDSDGNTVITYTPDLPYEVVILSSPDIITGETYTLTAGSSSEKFTAG